MKGAPKMPLKYLRKNGKRFLRTLQFLDHDLRIPLDELEAIAAKYRPQLESLGILDGLYGYQELWLWVELWEHEKGRNIEIRD